MPDFGRQVQCFSYAQTMKTIKYTKRKAFTLIELLVVIVIIGILATITVPNISKYRRKADYTKLLSLDQQIKKLIGLGLEVELQMDYYDDGGTDKVRDTSGQNRDATIHGDADLLVDFDLGVGKAAYFDGTGDYITVPEHDIFHSDEFTISLMAKSDSEIWSNNGFLISKRPSFIIHPIINSKRVTFYTMDDLGNGHDVYCNNIDNITNWNHYMMSVKNGVLRGWLNGQLCDETPLTMTNPTIRDTSNPFYVGRDTNNTRILDGWIDNVRFFSVGIDKIQ